MLQTQLVAADIIASIQSVTHTHTHITLQNTLCPHQIWEPPSILSNGYSGTIPTGIKRTEHKANLSPSSAEGVLDTKRHDAIRRGARVRNTAQCAMRILETLRNKTLSNRTAIVAAPSTELPKTRRKVIRRQVTRRRGT
jgi:hypothetical protein